MVVTVHSFTPAYKGTPRAVELGILHDRDTRVSEKLIATFPGVDARFNELMVRRTACCTRSICMRRTAASRTS
jgi:predicted N-formylglutamate amidohydrolase